MNGKKSKIQGAVILLIVFAAFNVLAFMLPFVKTGAFWLAYGFTAFAILAQGYIFHIAFDKGEPLKSKLYGFPIARFGVIYLVVQLIAGFACMVLAKFVPIWVCLIVFVLILAAAAVGLISVDVVRDEIEQQDVKLVKDVTAMRAMQSKAVFIAGQCVDADTKAALEKLADTLRFSDPVSSEATAEAEATLAAYMDELQNAVMEGDSESVRVLCAKVEVALADRNRLCKLNK